MTSHRVNVRGGLLPIEERMSKRKLMKRAFKMEARRSVAEALAKEIGGLKLAIMGLARRVRFYRNMTILALLLTVLMLGGWLLDF